MVAHRSGIRINIIVCWIIGMLALIGIFLSFLALADIWHGEEDLSLEWSILRFAFAMMIIFIVASFFTLVRVWNFLKQTHGTAD